jgi:Uma2 family endonuclease
MATVAAPPLPELVRLLLPPSAEGRARFSRQAYQRLAEIGVLTGDARVELIDGEIYMMLPIGPPQGSLISLLNEFFGKHLPDAYQCRIQLPIAVSNHSEPQPDIAIVRRKENHYRDEHPIPSDVALLIEVSSSSLKFDLGRKLELYAGSRIGEYWVIDVDRQVAMIHRNPTGNRYEIVETFAAGSTIAPIAVPECHLDLTWLFR